RRHESDARRRVRASVADDACPVDAALLQRAHEEVAERVRADLSDRSASQAEPGERARGAERRSPGLQLDPLDELERVSLRERVDGTYDDVRDEDPEADDVEGRAGARPDDVDHGVYRYFLIEGVSTFAFVTTAEPVP